MTPELLQKTLRDAHSSPEEKVVSIVHQIAEDIVGHFDAERSAYCAPFTWAALDYLAKVLRPHAERSLIDIQEDPEKELAAIQGIVEQRLGCIAVRMPHKDKKEEH